MITTKMIATTCIVAGLFLSSCGDAGKAEDSKTGTETKETTEKVATTKKAETKPVLTKKEAIKLIADLPEVKDLGEKYKSESGGGELEYLYHEPTSDSFSYIEVGSDIKNGKMGNLLMKFWVNVATKEIEVFYWYKNKRMKYEEWSKISKENVVEEY